MNMSDKPAPVTVVESATAAGTAAMVAAMGCGFDARLQHPSMQFYTNDYPLPRPPAAVHPDIGMS